MTSANENSLFILFKRLHYAGRIIFCMTELRTQNQRFTDSDTCICNCYNDLFLYYFQFKLNFIIIFRQFNGFAHFFYQF